MVFGEFLFQLFVDAFQDLLLKRVVAILEFGLVFEKEFPAAILDFLFEFGILQEIGESFCVEGVHRVEMLCLKVAETRSNGQHTECTCSSGGN